MLRWKVLATPFLVSVCLASFLYLIYSLSTPGGWTEWSPWSKCSKSCGQGLRGHIRKCLAPSPGLLGKNCEGPLFQSEKCTLRECPVNGGFSNWGVFGECDKTCGSGIRTRTRECNNPEPAHGGITCKPLGAYRETSACNVSPCPVNGGFSDWGAYSTCEITDKSSCGKGKKVRTRTCNKPVPQYLGKPCEGKDTELAECEIPCPTTTTTTNSTTINSTTTNTTNAPK